MMGLSLNKQHSPPLKGTTRSISSIKAAEKPVFSHGNSTTTPSGAATSQGHPLSGNSPAVQKQSPAVVPKQLMVLTLLFSIT